MQLTEQLLGHKLGIGGDTLQQRDGHDGDGSNHKNGRQMEILGGTLTRLGAHHLGKCKNMDNRDKFYFFNEVLLPSAPVMFTL
ncbi:unnamed protein product [Porites lobata]|uniref:Uncharacterized protein n=1 Tax=Porites lobata TaxID=104759 RepID=A0ABN8NDN5_9CNID|nr:unnamed protein product [Porites lobata]